MGLFMAKKVYNILAKVSAGGYNFSHLDGVHSFEREGGETPSQDHPMQRCFFSFCLAAAIKELHLCGAGLWFRGATFVLQMSCFNPCIFYVHMF